MSESGRKEQNDVASANSANGGESDTGGGVKLVVTTGEETEPVPEVSTAIGSDSPAKVLAALDSSIPGQASSLPSIVGSFTLDTTATVKEKVRSFSERNSVHVMAILGGMLFACWMSFGGLASVGVILLLCGLILLTKLTKLSNRCELNVGEKLNISLVDLLGKSTLSVSRRQVKAVREGADSFIIELESDFLNVAQKAVFNSLFQARSNPSVLRIPFDGMVSESQRDAIKAALSLFMGSAVEKAVVPVDKFAAPIPVDDGITRVMYSPNKVARDNAAKWMRKNNWKVSSLLFAAGLAITLALGISQTFVVLMTIGLVCFLAALHEREKPQYLGFSADGIAFMWNRKSGETKTHTIPWECLSHVTTFCSTGRKQFDTMIDFRLMEEKLPAPQRMTFRMMLPEYFHDNPMKLRLRTGGLEGPDARHNLLEAIRKYVPSDRVDSEVFKVLNPTDPESYTTLWLETLGNAPRRFAEGHLPTGHMLDNGRFEIIRLLGAGGQATAYLANEKFDADGQPLQDKVIVLKEFILPSHAGAELSSRSLEHIKREHELIKRIHNEQVVEYYGLFVEDHRAYLILEHIDGPSLRDYVVEHGPLSREMVLDLALQMTEILAHLHNQSPPVVHRDFTPENLLLEKSGKLKLIDFNVAQELETNATRTIVGKHSYIPPEQFRGKPLPQSDIDAMGAGLYFLLTGEEPDPISVSHPILKRSETGGELDELVARATQTDLTKRFGRAEDIKEAIQRILSSEAPKVDSSESPSAI
ncbi:MAG: serine/threonine protein kinase [Candidatus Obscuribacterales bacterium]|nr:serine/threonine protein kinase [Candidatus Obscuribacterales bacterium]